MSDCKVLKTHRFFDEVTTTGETAQYLTDYRFGGATERTIQGVLTSGAQVKLYTYTSPTDETVEHLVSTFAASTFSTVIDGPVAKIKVEMVSGGTAWIEGLV